MSENKFQRGNTVICVDQGNCGPGIVTVGKKYAVLDADDIGITFINDEGDQDHFAHRFFKLDLNQGTKHDQGKPDLSLIPTDALWGMGAALTYGANKYDRHNFRAGISYSRLVAATMRHLSAWNEGENVDSESHLNHIDHALASLAMLKYMITNKPEMDDRYIVKKPVDKK